MKLSVEENLLRSAYRLVSFRPRSEREMRQYLLKKTKNQYVNPRVLDEVIDRMRELGYVDDRAFAAWWIEQRRTFRPKGILALNMELRKKGIDRDIIVDVLPRSGSTAVAADDASSERSLALKAVARRIIRWQNLPDVEKRRKVYAFLQQRGFTSQTIRSVIDEVAGKSYNTTQS